MTSPAYGAAAALTPTGEPTQRPPIRMPTKKKTTKTIERFKSLTRRL
jgi:hypothetical protein